MKFILNHPLGMSLFKDFLFLATILSFPSYCMSQIHVGELDQIMSQLENDGHFQGIVLL